MNSIHRIRNIFALALTMIVISCDDFIDKQPIDQRSQSTFFTDETTTRTAVTGAYRSLTSSFAYGQAFIVIPEFAAGHMAHISSFPEYVEYQNFNIRIDNPWSLNMWTAFYTTINAANNILFFAPRIDGYDNNQNIQNLVKEAHFIRGLTYFNLVRSWGDVPLITTPTDQETTDERIRVARNSVEEVYNAILEDLIAASSLPAGVGLTGSAKGRASGLAAKALLSKVYLYSGDYEAAAELAGEVISTGGFGLASDFSSIWLQENSPEAIFELQFDQQTPNTFVQNANPASRQEFFANPAALDLYEEEDSRRNFTLWETTDNSGNVRLYVGKYRNFNPPAQNVPILRLAEVLLIHAEARARVEGTVSPAAMESLMEVRARAGLGEPSVTDLNEFIQLVQEEKRREMMFEFETWYDHCRTGFAMESIGVTNPGRFLFPIPQLELDLNPNLNQNFGY